MFLFVFFYPARRAGRKFFLKRKLVLRWIYVRGVALPAELAGRARTQNLRSRGIPWSPNIFLSANLFRWLQLTPSLSASRTRRQSSHTELALPLPPVLPPKNYFGELVWLASVGPQFVFRRTCLVGPRTHT